MGEAYHAGKTPEDCLIGTTGESMLKGVCRGRRGASWLAGYREWSEVCFRRWSSMRPVDRLTNQEVSIVLSHWGQDK